MEPGCLRPTLATRCDEHEAVWQARRNARRGAGRKPSAPYRKVSLVGQACWCCGTTEDLTRHHVQAIGRVHLRDRQGGELEYDGLIPMCRRCNSSIGTKRMAGLACPLHGGIEA